MQAKLHFCQRCAAVLPTSVFQTTTINTHAHQVSVYEVTFEQTLGEIQPDHVGIDYNSVTLTQTLCSPCTAALMPVLAQFMSRAL